MRQKKIHIYTVTMAKLLHEWRTSQGISRYEIAKQTGIHINTVKRFEDGEGGVTFEDGFRFFLYAESHKSKPNLLKKFREAMATYHSEQEKADVVNAIQKQRMADTQRKASERQKIEQAIRLTVQKEMAEQLTSLTERHKQELADAKRQGAEEAKQEFAQMSWLERLQGK